MTFNKTLTILLALSIIQANAINASETFDSYYQNRIETFRKQNLKPKVNCSINFMRAKKLKFANNAKINYIAYRALKNVKNSIDLKGQYNCQLFSDIASGIANSNVKFMQYAFEYGIVAILVPPTERPDSFTFSEMIDDVKQDGIDCVNTFIDADIIEQDDLDLIEKIEDKSKEIELLVKRFNIESRFTSFMKKLHRIFKLVEKYSW